MRLTLPSFAPDGLRALLPPADATLALSAALVFGAGRLVPKEASSRETYEVWYPSLRKPAWNPPRWVFPAVWIPLKLLQSCAVARLLSHARLERAASPGALLPSGTTTLALSSYVVMTLLGNAWNAVFFGKRQLKKSVAVMGAFWASLLASIVTAERADHAAGVLIAPTLVWVTIAAALNYSIVQLNKDKWE